MPVFGHDLLSLLSQMGGTANVEALRNAAAGAFGPEAVYTNCHGAVFSFPEVLAFLASKGKLEHRGDEVFLGSAPACSGH
jgi:probable metal-binding protein